MKLFREILIAENCEVIECADPMFAMDKISNELPNLILMIYSCQEFLAMI